MQAARSCRQNIVEGSADGVTSTEMKLKLLNVARNSIKELKTAVEFSHDSADDNKFFSAFAAPGF